MVSPGPEKDACMSWSPCLIRCVAPEGRVALRLGHPLVDDFLALAGCVTADPGGEWRVSLLPVSFGYPEGSVVGGPP